jgi:hypothetical protein
MWEHAPSQPPAAPSQPPAVVSARPARPAAPRSIWRDLDPLRFADEDAEAAYQSYAADYARGSDGAGSRGILPLHRAPG